MFQSGLKKLFSAQAENNFYIGFQIFLLYFHFRLREANFFPCLRLSVCLTFFFCISRQLLIRFQDDKNIFKTFYDE